MIRSHDDFYRITQEYNIGVILIGKLNGFPMLNYKLHETTEFPEWSFAFEDDSSYVYVRKDVLESRP
jgi:hypothetical protein